MRWDIHLLPGLSRELAESSFGDSILTELGGVKHPLHARSDTPSGRTSSRKLGSWRPLFYPLRAFLRKLVGGSFCGKLHRSDMVTGVCEKEHRCSF